MISLLLTLVFPVGLFILGKGASASSGFVTEILEELFKGLKNL